MGKEIERKYLVANDDWRADAESSVYLRQGYLHTSERTSIRVRVSDAQAWLNIKSGTLAIERDEFEYRIPLEDGEILLERFTVGAIIEKRRHRVRAGRHVWELDVFAGANLGLVLAEIELGSPEEAFTAPSWLGRDVSLERRYYNPALVEHPYGEWSMAEKRGDPA